MIIVENTKRNLGVQIVGDERDLKNLYAQFAVLAEVFPDSSIDQDTPGEVIYDLMRSIRDAYQGDDEKIKLFKTEDEKYAPDYYLGFKVTWPRIIGCMVAYKAGDKKISYLANSELKLLFAKIIDAAFRISDSFGKALGELNKEKIRKLKYWPTVVTTVEMQFVNPELSRKIDHELLPENLNPEELLVDDMVFVLEQQAKERKCMVCELAYPDNMYNGWKW